MIRLWLKFSAAIFLVGALDEGGTPFDMAAAAGLVMFLALVLP